MIKVAVNGFGRIGALFVRAFLENKRGQFKIAAINASGSRGNMSPQDVAHRLKYDSNYGRLDETIEPFPDSIVYFPKSEGVENVSDGGRIAILGEPDTEKLPWKKLGVDIVIDCTGELLTVEKAEKHIKAGAKKVLLSAPPKDDEIPMFVFGVNHQDYRPEMKIISNASCTTNALAPITEIIRKNWEIVFNPFVTVHAFTNDQNLVDGKHKDPRRSRRAADNIIPTSTGAAKNITKIYSDLAGKGTGLAYRVNTSTVSIVHIIFTIAGSPAKEEIIREIKKAANGHLREILTYTEEKLVSADFVKNPHSAIVDIPLISVLKNETAGFVKVTEVDGVLIRADKRATIKRISDVQIAAWYDNEWAYAARLADLLNYVISKM